MPWIKKLTDPPVGHVCEWEGLEEYYMKKLKLGSIWQCPKLHCGKRWELVEGFWRGRHMRLIKD